MVTQFGGLVVALFVFVFVSSLVCGFGWFSLVGAYCIGISLWVCFRGVGFRSMGG